MFQAPFVVALEGSHGTPPYYHIPLDNYTHLRLFYFSGGLLVSSPTWNKTIKSTYRNLEISASQFPEMPEISMWDWLYRFCENKFSIPKETYYDTKIIQDLNTGRFVSTVSYNYQKHSLPRCRTLAEARVRSYVKLLGLMNQEVLERFIVMAQDKTTPVLDEPLKF